MLKVVACVLGVLFLTAAGPVAQPVSVTMKSLTFDPKRVEIAQGQSVVWTNAAHTEHSASSEGAPSVFDTGMIAPGMTSSPVAFTKAGEYRYHCAMHGKTMSGVVVVKAAP